MVAIAWAILLCGVIWDCNQPLARGSTATVIFFLCVFVVFVVISIIELRR